MDESSLLPLALIIIVGIACQWFAWRVRLPAIVLLLLGGIIMGPVTGFLKPDEVLGDSLIAIVSLSVAIILFEGGMSLRFRELRGSGNTVAMLVLVGSIVTWSLAAVFAISILGMDRHLAILFGAIMIVTGPTVIGPLLRHVRPIGKSGTILKWEGLTIDPIGAIAAVLTYEFLFAEGSTNTPQEAIFALVSTFGVGTATGLAGAAVTVILLKKFWIPDFLISPSSVAFVVLAYVGANHFRPEAGLVAVTVMGIALANQKWVKVGHILAFKENLRVLLISSLFVILAARLQPSILSEITWQHALFIVALIVIVRPVAVFISTLGSGLSRAEKVFLSIMAPRGIVAAAVASIFALKLGGDAGGMIMTNTFLVVVSTVVIYGFAALPIARRLGLAQPEPNGLLLVGSSAFSREFAKELMSCDVQVKLIDTNEEKVELARSRGIDAELVNFLHEDEREEMDLNGIGSLLALTPNDNANMFLVNRGAEEFGRARVYRMAPRTSAEKQEKPSPKDHGGRVLFSLETGFDGLQDYYARGWIPRSMTISEENENDLKTGSEDRVLLATVSEEGKPDLFTDTHRPALKRGQKLLYLAPGEASD